MTGTASHCKIKIAAIEITASRYLGRLFLKEKSLNFRLINEMSDTMRKENNNTIRYNAHLFNNKSLIHNSFTFQKITGNEPINIPTAGVGNPLNEYDWSLARLNFARRHAAAQGNM